MSYIFHSFFLGIIFYALAHFYRGDHSKWIFYAGLLFSLVCGLLVGVSYQSYYQGGDTFLFYSYAREFNNSTDGKLTSYLHALFFKDIPILGNEPRTQFFVKLISPLVLFTPDYWILSLYMSLLSFVASWYFLTKVTTQFPDLRFPAYFAVLFFPSAIFWTSGILKDNLASVAAMFLIGSLLSFYWGQRLKAIEIIVAALCLVILIQLKFYAAGVLMVCGLLLLLSGFLSNHSLSVKLSAYLSVLILGFFLMEYLHPWMRLERLPLTIYENHTLILQRSSPNDVLTFMGLNPTYGSMMANLPLAIVAGLFRPFIWEHLEWISIGIRMENVVLIILVVLNLYKWRKISPVPIVITGLLLIFTLSGFIALSTPNFGTLSRYKSLYLPYFVLLISIIPFRYVLLQQQSNE